MKKSFLLLVIFNIVFLGIAQCPLRGSKYELDGNEEQFFCSILFIDDEYYMELSYNATEDIVYSLVLSYGNYFVKDSLVKLKDKIFGCEIFLSFNNKSNFLEVKKGFAFMSNRCFNYYGKSYEDDILITNHKDSAALSEERQRYVEKHTDLLPLSIGLYGSDSPFEYKLSLQEQQFYQLSYFDIILSKGQWKREGNILHLCDTTLNCTFHLLIGDGVLISKLLPGDDSGGFVLKKKSDNNPVTPPKRGFGCSRRCENKTN